MLQIQVQTRSVLRSYLLLLLILILITLFHLVHLGLIILIIFSSSLLAHILILLGLHKVHRLDGGGCSRWGLLAPG